MACGHCAEKPQCRKSQCRMPQYRKATVQKDTVQNGRSAEMGNVPIVLSSRVTEWHDVTTRNNQLNKTVLKFCFY